MKKTLRLLTVFIISISMIACGKASVNQAIERLESEGYVIKEASSSDYDAVKELYGADTFELIYYVYKNRERVAVIIEFKSEKILQEVLGTDESELSYTKYVYKNLFVIEYEYGYLGKETILPIIIGK